MFIFIKKVIKIGIVMYVYLLELMLVDKNFCGKLEYMLQQCIGCVVCVNVCLLNVLMVEIDLVINQLVWQFNFGCCIFCGCCEEVCLMVVIKLLLEYELVVWKKEDFFQQLCFVICYCWECQCLFVVQKEIDYVIVLFKYNGDICVELYCESFEICLECKCQKCLVLFDCIELICYMREVS